MGKPYQGPKFSFPLILTLKYLEFAVCSLDKYVILYIA